MINPKRKIAVCTLDEKGRVITSNDAHALMLGRERQAIVGHNFREWTPAKILDEAERVYARSLTGEPVVYERTFGRPDGSVLIGRSQLFATRHKRDRLVVGLMEILDLKPELLAPDAVAISEYIATLTRELAEMAAASGLADLGLKLADVAVDAGSVADTLSERAKRKLN